MVDIKYKYIICIIHIIHEYMNYEFTMVSVTGHYGSYNNYTCNNYFSA